MRPIRFIILAQGAMLFSLSPCVLTATAYEKKIPALRTVPTELPGEMRERLSTRRQGLTKELKDFQADANEFNAKLPEDQSDAEYNALQARRAQYIDKATAFNRDVISAVFALRLQDPDPNHRGIPITAPFRSSQGNRSAYDYAKAIDQFRVEESPRYDPQKAPTCNIFVWDVTRAMRAEIPHYVLKEDRGVSAVDDEGNFIVGREKIDRELTVNPTVEWLSQHGKRNGWRRIDARMAQKVANEGYPTVAIWKNLVPGPHGGVPHGHVAMVRPGSVPKETSGSHRGVAISQGGGSSDLVLNASHIDVGFNDQNLEKPVQYWYHD
jgi:hypothetical protein